MSVDTEMMRQWARSSGPLNIEWNVGELCDEIDRLSKDLDFETRCVTNAGNTIKELQTELSQLREQLRPRSIKDEPPPLGEWFWAWPYSYCDRTILWYPVKFNNMDALRATKFTQWLPAPTDPPQPDAFEVWWREFIKTKENLGTKSQLRLAWDAAIQSTK